MAEALRLVERAAPSNVPVLILGESGTGKEVFAQCIHRLSPRQQAPFVALNCAALPESLLEAELFGVERGTATGVEARAGKFEAAHGGTIFLDEIGDMSLATQARILRVLQEREVMRLGSHTPKRIDFRLLAATHRELPKLVEEGRFRQDLYYRLAIVTVTLPPLRERPEDLLPLARLFLRTLGPGHGHERPSLDGSAERALLAHAWPGNIRELRNVLERALLLSDDGVIRQADLGLSGGPRRSAPGAAAPGLRALRPDAAEQARTIREALEACRGRKGEAARALGISRETLRLKLRRLGLD
jgi:transcriptional regulator with PAS, ATPase and Fis domain